MSYAIYSTEEAANSVLAILNPAYLATVVEYRADGTPLPPPPITKSWAEKADHYVQGWGFLTPPNQFLNILGEHQVFEKVDKIAPEQS